MNNLLTFDIEEWYHANFPAAGIPEKQSLDERLESNVQKLLDLCEKHDARATFFVLGETAEKYPGAVLRIKEKGHEIASHGYRHELVYSLAPEAFAADLRKSMDVLEPLARQKIIGYRAPSWSVLHHMGWFFDILKKNGLAYDSSLFPAKTYLYGDRRAQRFPHKINGLDEIPASTLVLGRWRIPFASGFFFRFFPYFLIRAGIRNLNRRGQPGMICLHPREMDASSPRLALPPRDRFIHFFHLKTTEIKLDKLLAAFKFCSIRDYLT